MFDVVLAVFSSLLSAVLLFLFYYYYMKPHEWTIRMIVGIIFSYAPILMSVALIPYELSQSIANPEYSEKEKKTLLYCIYALYYFTMIISYFIMPILINFESTSPADTFWKRVRDSLKRMLKLYGIICAVALIVVILTIIIGKIKINSDLILYLLSTIPFCMNIYGLMFSLIIVGIGIIRIPFHLWVKSGINYNMTSKLIRLNQIDDPNNREFKRIIRQLKSDMPQYKKYENSRYPIQLHLRRIGYCMLAFFVSALSIFFIILEGSYSFRHSLVAFFCDKIDNTFLVHLFLIILIGALTLLSIDVLTRFDPSSFLPRFCFNRLTFISFFTYQFEKSKTTQNTFDMWSDRIQKLLPALAFHCQYMSNVTDSSLKIIMGEFREYNEFDLAIRLCGLALFTLSFITSIFHSISNVLDNIRNAELGEDLFKRHQNQVGDVETDDQTQDDIHVNLQDIQFVDNGTNSTLEDDEDVEI